MEKIQFKKSLWEMGSKIDPNRLLGNGSLLVAGTKSVKGKSRNNKNQLTNVKSQGSNLDSFSFMRPQSMKEGYERRNRKTKSKKGKNTK